MKTYSWEQVIGALRENNNLVFQTKDGRLTLRVTDGIAKGYDEHDNLKKFYGLDLDEKFVRIQKSVSFIEAIKSYSEGKTITCKVGTDKYEYKPYHAEETSTLWNELITDADSSITSYEILNGKWYIEEDI